MIRQLDDHMMVCGQVAPHEVAGLAEQGITVLVNNRPAGEESGQPLAGDIESMQHAVRDAEGGKLLAFCRSGTRSALTLALAKREEGAPAEEVTRLLTDAGFDPAPIAHLL